MLAEGGGGRGGGVVMVFLSGNVAARSGEAVRRSVAS